MKKAYVEPEQFKAWLAKNVPDFSWDKTLTCARNINLLYVREEPVFFSAKPQTVIYVASSIYSSRRWDKKTHNRYKKTIRNYYMFLDSSDLFLGSYPPVFTERDRKIFRSKPYLYRNIFRLLYYKKQCNLPFFSEFLLESKKGEDIDACRSLLEQVSWAITDSLDLYRYSVPNLSYSHENNKPDSLKGTPQKALSPSDMPKVNKAFSCSYSDPYWSGESFDYTENTLYVTYGPIRCEKDKHPIKSMTATIPGFNLNPIRINIHCCPTCRLFFIHKFAYDEYLKRNRVLLVKFGILDETGKKTFDPNSFPEESSTLREESVLKLCGYSVSKQEGLSVPTRWALLAGLVHSGILEKRRIMDYLEFFIRFNGSQDRMADACKEWQTDYNFIMSYNLDAQDAVSITKIRAYYEKNKYKLR